MTKLPAVEGYDGDLIECDICKESHPPGPGFCKERQTIKLTKEAQAMLPKPYQLLSKEEKLRALETLTLDCCYCRKAMLFLKSSCNKPEMYCADCHSSAPLWGVDINQQYLNSLPQKAIDEILGN